MLPGYSVFYVRMNIILHPDGDSGGNNTDPGCGNVTCEVGNYLYCTEYGNYRSANIYNAHQTRRRSHSVTGWPVLNGKGWYWLCGNKDREVLPLGWKGACTLRAIILNITIIEDMQNQSPGLLEAHLRKIKRTSVNPLVERGMAFHSSVRWFIPWLGVNELEKAIVNISAIAEELENNTSDVIWALQEELTSLSEIVFQNLMVLDLLLDL